MKVIRSSIYGFFAVLTLGFLLGAPQARAETTQCTAITSLPATISTQGIYCLTGNLATNLASGNAILINVNNVTIDLNGYKIGNLAAGDGTLALGIFADQKKNITIRNGIIRGFHFGIRLFGPGSGHLVEDMILDGNPYVGMSMNNIAGATVRNNRVVDTGGSTNQNDAWGIEMAFCFGATVTNNSISGTHGTNGSFAVGLSVNFSDNSTAKGNRVTDTSTGSGAVYGIWAGNNNNSVLENNVVTGTSSSGTRYGINNSPGTNTQIIGNRISDTDLGVFCGSATSEARDNSFTAVTTPISGCTNSGNNT
jgi:hypothetical protein